MYLQILKKDLVRKKSMNAILFIFIVLCTLFMASSLNNMITTSNAITYFGEVTKAPDYLFITTTDDEVDQWLSDHELVESFSEEQGLIISPDSVLLGDSRLDKLGSLFLFTLPTQHNLVLDEHDEVITSIGEGEIALTAIDAEHAQLSIGDIVTIIYGDKEKDLVLTNITKDMVFGSSYMGMARLIVCEEDFDDFASEGLASASFYSVITSEAVSFERSLMNRGMVLFSNFDKAMLENIYTMDMMAAAIFMVVSVLLILIAFVILRFTITFTLQEDYREIGVMKAIGLKSRMIKRLYLIKYLALSLAGAVLGVALSFPMSSAMTQNIQKNMAMESASANPFLSIFAGIIIVALVLMFCLLTLRKVHKLSAIQAMRSGALGENYKTRKIYSINKHLNLPLPFQMALNDLLCTMKNYVVLVITFVLGTLMVILPVNAANTLRSEEIVEYFGVAQSDVYIITNEEEQLFGEGSREAIESKIKELELLYSSKGIDLDFHVEVSFTTAVYLHQPDESTSLMAFQSSNLPEGEYFLMDEKSAPLLANEVAFTQLALDRIGAQVGDTVHIKMGDQTDEYLITGTYESMNMMGYNMRFSEAAPLDYRYLTGIWAFQGNFVEREDISGQIETLKKITPDYKIQTTTEFADSTLGSTITTIEAIKNMILVVVLLINSLITVLLVRSFLAQDAGEIALLRSIGFKDATLRLWQALRIIVVLFCSIVLGVLLSAALNPLVVQLTFGIMGASKVPATIIWQEVYLLYPLTLFAATSAAALLSVTTLKKFNLKNVGPME